MYQVAEAATTIEATGVVEELLRSEVKGGEDRILQEQMVEAEVVSLDQHTLI